MVLAAPGRGAVAVLGGGAVGLATAWLVRRSGAAPVRCTPSASAPATTIPDCGGGRWFPSSCSITEFRNTSEIMRPTWSKALLFFLASALPATEFAEAMSVDLIHKSRLGLRRPHRPGWVDALLADLIPRLRNVSIATCFSRRP